MRALFRWRVLLAAAVGVAFIAAVYPLVFTVSPKQPAAAPVEEPKKDGPKRAVIGKSVEGRSIEATTYGNGPKHVLFAGGMHGGYEWNSVLLAHQMMDYFTDHPEAVPSDITLAIIPVVNPDGLYRIIGKEGRFTFSDVPAEGDHAPGRFNARDVDLNRNFDCKWQPESMWKNRTVSGGTEAFSEPESRALRDFVTSYKPQAVAFWHSKSNAVYASECENGILPVTREVMRAYADAAGYPSVDSFDSYSVTGDAEGWLASIGIPAITVELKTHEDIEWDKNLAGVHAFLRHFSAK